MCQCRSRRLRAAGRFHLPQSRRSERRGRTWCQRAGGTAQGQAGAPALQPVPRLRRLPDHGRAAWHRNPHRARFTEVTYAQWDACFRESACHRYLPDDGFGRGDRPAGGVTWLDALEYVTWLGSKTGADAPCIDYRPAHRRRMEAGRFVRQPWPGDLGSRRGRHFAGVLGLRPGAGWQCRFPHGFLARQCGRPLRHGRQSVGMGREDRGLCDFAALRQTGLCAPGRVMGGSYATRADALVGIGEGGLAPRTGNDRPWSSPTIGFRVACDVKPAA